MINYNAFYKAIEDGPLASLKPVVEDAFQNHVLKHGTFPAWNEALESLPDLHATEIDLSTSVTVRGAALDDYELNALESSLSKLHPWRKGPFSIHGVEIETEWRSDWKWDRVINHIQPLKNRTILDVGCGSGYHCWRMAGAGASMVVGIEPSPLFIMQYFACKHFIGERNVHVLPLGIEQLPPKLEAFDTVFSMGILYHRRSPLDHLLELKNCLRPGGELVLETIVVDGELGYTLMPEGRYAKMRNVWFIPSVPTLELWLRRSGFKNIRTIDVTTTTIQEQRSTPWMQFESLSDFLDPNDQNLTIEGYPGPKRATIVAEK